MAVLDEEITKCNGYLETFHLLLAEVMQATVQQSTRAAAEERLRALLPCGEKERAARHVRLNLVCLEEEEEEEGGKKKNSTTQQTAKH